MERALSEIVSLIGDGKIADYYRRDFEQQVFDAFKRRPAQTAPRTPYRGREERGGKQGRFTPPIIPVSSEVKNSLLVRSGRGGAIKVKEAELCRLLLEDPEIAVRHGETLAALPFSDPLLDRFRHELLNLAASGARLEGGALHDHLMRQGMADLLARLQATGTGDSSSSDAPQEAGYGLDIEARFLRAAGQLREMAELEPERARAAERFKSEATEESWQDYQRLRGGE